MSEFDLALRGGTIVTASDKFRADVGVKDGKIGEISKNVAGASREIDVSGLYVLPGGVDAHVHMAQPTNDGTIMADDFASGTQAAAAGGNTTVLPFALQIKGKS
ncbi:MAG: dihydropyrimidinase, partial [Paracoccaceae bacterium]